MRVRFVALCGVAVLAATAIGPPRAAANGKDTKEEAAVVKAAGAAVRTIVRGTARQIRAAAAGTTGRIAELDRAAKTGKGVETLSGVPSTPEIKVSPEQRAGLLDACVQNMVRFDDECLEYCRDAYEAFAASPACQSLAETQSTNRLAGTGGPLDQFTTGLADAWVKGSDTVDRAVQKFQGTLTNGGTAFTYVAGPSPAFTTPTFVTPPDRVFDTPLILGTFGDSDGGLRALVAYPGDTPIGDFRAANTSVVAASTAGTLGFETFQQVPGGEEGDRGVHLYTERLNSSFIGEGRVFLLDRSTDALRPMTPVRIVDPGPCAPAGGNDDITSSTPDLDLGIAQTGQSPSRSFVLTNNSSSPIEVTFSIVATGNNANKFTIFNSSMRTILNGSTAGVGVGADSTTAGTFDAILRVTWPGGTLDVPLTVRFTN